MKAYYIGCILGGIVIGLILLGVCSIVSCSSANKIQDEYVKYEVENTLELRYYLDDDYENAKVAYVRVYDGADYEIKQIPKKEGYNFVGLFSSPDPETRVLYVGTNGRGVAPLSGNMLLYPVFELLEE